MKTPFAFGKAGIEVAIPESFECQVLHGRSAGALSDAKAALDAALDAPIGAAPLKELAKGKRTAAISVCDITRPAPNSVTLPPVLKRLHEGGIPVEGITILIATGLHRAATPEEVVAIVGPEIARSYRVESHDAKDFEAHRSLGSTSRGTPVYIDERFVAADLHITLGFVEQHLMLGFSGGRKLIAPGQAAQQTIKGIHAPRFMREPMATEGSIEENPLHAELLEIARMARHDFMLDVTLTRERGISGVFAGDPVKAHAAAVEFIRNTSLEHIPALADAVVTSAAGYPLDLTFYQVLKGVTAAQHIVKPGGPILVLAECAEGIGSPEFMELVASYPGHQGYLDRIREAAVVVDQWQLEKLALCGLKHPVLFYTPRLKKEALGALGDAAFSNLDAAVAAMLKGLPAGARVALIPEGPYTFARADD
jgi:nickel-dependent lactate racemase